jgi:hypothetical protein
MAAHRIALAWYGSASHRIGMVWQRIASQWHGTAAHRTDRRTTLRLINLPTVQATWRRAALVRF